MNASNDAHRIALEVEERRLRLSRRKFFFFGALLLPVPKVVEASAPHNDFILRPGDRLSVDFTGDVAEHGGVYALNLDRLDVKEDGYTPTTRLVVNVFDPKEDNGRFVFVNPQNHPLRIKKGWITPGRLNGFYAPTQELDLSCVKIHHREGA